MTQCGLVDAKNSVRKIIAYLPAEFSTLSLKFMILINNLILMVNYKKGVDFTPQN